MILSCHAMPCHTNYIYKRSLMIPCNEYTASPFPTRQCSSNGWSFRRRPSRGTTASWAPNKSCSFSTSYLLAAVSGCLMELGSTIDWSSSFATSTGVGDMKRSSLRTYSTWIYGRYQDMRCTTRTACSPLMLRERSGEWNPWTARDTVSCLDIEYGPTGNCPFA